MALKRGIAALLAIVAGAAVSAAFAFSVSAADEMIALRGAGATFPAPLYKRWIEAYEKDHPHVALSYDPVGSGEGIERFTAGTVDFGASDVVLSREEAAKAPYGVTQVPVTAGMIVLAYNLSGLSGRLRLSREVYESIFAGRIRRWDDPLIKQANPSLQLPPRDIAIVVRQDSSGTTEGFTAHLAAVDSNWASAGPGVGMLAAWPNDAMLARGNEGVASRIKISEGSVGYVEYGFAERLGLPTALVENKAGRYVEANRQNGEAALLADLLAGPGSGGGLAKADPNGESSYPIVSYSWLLLHRRYPDARKGSEVREFVRWGLTAGQSFAAELGYIPLAPGLADHAISVMDATD